MNPTIQVNVSGHQQPADTPMTTMELTHAVNRSVTELPANLTEQDAGYRAFHPTLGIPVWWNGSAWVDANGFTPDIHKGTTEQRPVGRHYTDPEHTIIEGTLVEPRDVGYPYFDTELGIIIYVRSISRITGQVIWSNADGTDATEQQY